MDISSDLLSQFFREGSRMEKIESRAKGEKIIWVWAHHPAWLRRR